MFVDSKDDVSHNCAACKFRVMPNACAIVKGVIDMDRGTCNYGVAGPAASKEDIGPASMDFYTAGYVLAPVGVKVQCGSCKFFQKGDCILWEDSVDSRQCCAAWTNDKMVEPPPDLGEKRTQLLADFLKKGA